MRGLFVGDEPSVLKQTKVFLVDADDWLGIDTGTSAEKESELLEEYEHDAIFSDYQILEMNGLDFLETVREEGESVVNVIDDGKGISDEEKEKIFERGFRKGEESGFGFSLVRGIVEDYEGEIEVKDSECGGARFDVGLKKI